MYGRKEAMDAMMNGIDPSKRGTENSSLPPPMPFAYVKVNVNYGGTLINQKYSPLEIDSLDLRSITLENLFKHRFDLFSPIKEVNFFTDRDFDINNGKAPFVVVSSGRAEWVSRKFVKYRESLDKGLVYQKGLFYDPLRSGRKLVVVVHETERSEYQSWLGKVEKVLKEKELHEKYPLEVELVGWRMGELRGFGASRFAAIEFLKFIGRDMAWLIDDNVTDVRGLLSLEKIEQDLKDASYTALSFNATTKNSSSKELKPHDDRHQYTSLDHPKPKPTTLVQQVVLWDIDRLRKRGLNFCPYFITSNEDVSFTQYLFRAGCAIGQYKAYPIIKLDSKVSNTTQSRKVFSDVLEELSKREGGIQVETNKEKVSLSDLAINSTLSKSGNNKAHMVAQMVEQLVCKYLGYQEVPPKKVELLFKTSVTRNLTFTPSPQRSNLEERDGSQHSWTSREKARDVGGIARSAASK